MNCPKCNSSELDQAGACPACGFQAPMERPPADKPEELPQWRIDLSRRLQEIKEKRGVPDPPLAPGRGTLPFPQAVPAPPEPRAQTPAASPKPNLGTTRTATSQPGIPDRIDAVLKPASAQAGAASGDARHIIDDAVSKRTATVRPVRAPAPPAAALYEQPEGENKLILLSRTLSGMIDLLAIFLCTVAFVVAEDVFSGIETFDQFSFINASVVFVTTYLLYSLFFLGTANQTIGMMMTHLRLAAQAGGRPSFGRILSRCVLFVLSVAVLGVGLLWGCFDPESRCLHDHLSGTRVEPLFPAI